VSDEEYIVTLRSLNEALLIAIDMERQRSNDLEEKHRTIKSLLQRPGNQLGPDITKELRELVHSSNQKVRE